LDVRGKSVLRKIPGPKKDEITREQKKLHEKCHDMYSPKHFTRVMKFKMGRACGKHRRNRYF